MEQIIPSWESSTLDSVEMLYTLTDYYFRQNQLVYICIYIGTNKSAKNPISDGEEYIVTIEETSKSGTGVAKIRGFVVLVNNSNSKVYFIYNKHKISYLPWDSALFI